MSKSKKLVSYNNHNVHARPEKKPRKWPQPVVVPNKAYTVEELVQKSKTGQIPTSIERTTQYVDEAQFEMIKDLFKPNTDLTDKQDVLRRINRAKAIITEVDIEAKNIAAEAKTAAEFAKLEAKVRADIKAEEAAKKEE